MFIVSAKDRIECASGDLTFDDRSRKNNPHVANCN